MVNFLQSINVPRHKSDDSGDFLSQNATMTLTRVEVTPISDVVGEKFAVFHLQIKEGSSEKCLDGRIFQRASAVASELTRGRQTRREWWVLEPHRHPLPHFAELKRHRDAAHRDGGICA